MKQTQVIIYCIVFWLGLIVSGIAPKDRFTWLMEVFPAIIGFAILALTYAKFKFTHLTYGFILLHAYVLYVGGHYTYAEVPWFDTIRDFFHQDRNNYDKVGHFMQGFVPAFICREILIRKNIVSNNAWVSIITVCICVTFSVLYEFLEWGVALLSGENADAFLGTQGYVWDTQSDMLYAMIGAISMLVFFGKVQKRMLAS
ncbi:MAG: DUF2238 domain-containing protein [Bacteroidetes bacterium]|nr:DUF2238 domain-containing protein [Bacteroidota bacterium]